MSAFIVSEAHIQAIVATAQRIDRWHGLPDANSLGRILWMENVASVKYRYHDEPESDLPGPGDWKPGTADRFRFWASTPSLPIVTFLKQLACLEYQSCEHPDWETSKARKLIERMQDMAISCLPGYEEAPWGID